jgi:endoglucanase
MKLLLACSLTLLLVLPAFAASLAPQSAFTPLDPSDQVKQMARGVNILGYDPIWHNFADARFKQRHFAVIHDGGFQTVRVNLQAFRHMNAQNQLPPAYLATLDWVVQNALANHLNVIIDEHDYNPMATNPAGNTPKLLAFWRQIGERYKNQPNTVLFEMLNEPHDHLDAPAWNALLKQCLAVIRKTNPTRNVVIGPSSWNGIHALSKLELPADDRHIIVTVHYYSPMEFTHQGASWNEATKNLSGITWGTGVQMKTVATDFASVQNWSQAHNRPILLGEFGAYERGDMASRVKYTSCVARTAESLGWAWTYWQFDSDFIAYDMNKDDWVHPIWKALVP